MFVLDTYFQIPDQSFYRKLFDHTTFNHDFNPEIHFLKVNLVFPTPQFLTSITPYFIIFTFGPLGPTWDFVPHPLEIWFDTRILGLDDPLLCISSVLTMKSRTGKTSPATSNSKHTFSDTSTH